MPRQHLTGVDVVTGLDSVDYTVSGPGDVRVVLRDAGGQEVASGAGPA